MFLTPLEKLAAQVAIRVPIKRGKYSVSARVSWDLIETLRRELETRGFDWQAARVDMLRILVKNRASKPLDT